MKICSRCSDLLPDQATECPKDGSALRPVLDPLVGRTIGGRYRLISRIGAGGMSSVYLARHVLIDRLMAIKILRRDLAQDPVQRDRFIREARAVNRINHQNIVEITDFGETDDGLVYLVMEYVPGDSLLKVMQQGAMDAGRALGIAHQIGSALGRAHQMGVVHRDLKPENVLLVPRKGEADFVKVLDFGIAKIMDAPSLTGSQQIFGTPGYIAPEYIQSTAIDGRADLYSLGVILYELVTGALPFDYEYPGDLLVKHVTEKPIAPKERLTTIDACVEELLLRCLEKDPADRFRDAHHFLEELDKVRERIGSPASWGAMSEPGGAPVHEVDPGADDAMDFAQTLATSTSRPRLEAVTGDAPVQPRRDTLVESVPAGRPPTREYSRSDLVRPQIPQPPAIEQVSIPAHVRVDTSATDDTPSQAVPRSTPPGSTFDPAKDGILGVRRWRKRHDVLRAYIDELEVAEPATASVIQAMAMAASTLEALESTAALAEEHQAQVEATTESARGLRAELGARIDAAAGRLSHARGELETLVAQRDALREQRDALRKKVRHGQITEAAADGQLWELAAVEERLRTHASACDELEAELAELRGELERESEATELELAALVHTLDRELEDVEALAHRLREPLDAAEAFVRGRWASELDQAGRPHGRAGTPPEP